MRETFTSFREKGLPVIPVYFKKKNPVPKDWSKYCVELPDSDTVEGWDRLLKIEPYNYGLCLGPVSGLVAVDIDKDSAMGLVPTSPYSKKGKKGETRFFRYKGEESQKFHEIGVEILSVGNQTAIPPSIHPETGSPYVWTGLYNGFDSIIDLPDLPPDFARKIGILNDKAKSQGTDKAGRHVTLVKMMTAMMGDKLPASEICNKLNAYDQANHSPPYFTDPNGQTLEYFTHTMFKSLKGLDLKSQSELDISSLIAEQPEDEDEPVNEYKPVKIDILEPRGIMKDVFDFIQLHSVHKEASSPLATAGALAFMSSLCGRKFFGNLAHANERGLPITPNLYMVGLAPSGFGKNAPREALKKLMKGKGILQEGSWKSGSAFMKELSKNPIRLDMQDEIQGLFNSMTQDRHYLQEIQECFLTAYSSAASVMGGTKAATEGVSVKDVEMPHVTLMGYTTPQSFTKSVKPIMLQNGLFARMMFFNCEHKAIDLDKVRASWKPEEEEHLYSRISKCFSLLTTMRMHYIQSSKNYLADDKPIYLTFTPEAIHESDLFAAHYQKLTKKAQGQWMTSFFNRMRENAARLALLDHMSLMFEAYVDDRPAPQEIGLESVQWGQAVVMACFSSVFENMEGLNSTGTDYESVVNAIESKVAGAGEFGIREGLLNKNLATKEKFQLAKKNLLESGRIIKLGSALPPGQKRTTTYFMTPIQLKAYYKARGMKPAR